LKSFHSKKKKWLGIAPVRDQKRKIYGQKKWRSGKKINKNLSKNFYTDPGFLESVGMVLTGFFFF